PDTGEQALEITDMLVRSNAVDIVVIDSVAALTPRAEIEGEMGEMQVGLQARLMSQALRKLTGNIKRSNTIVVFINQMRMKIGVMFGNPETTTGGNALKFYASVRLDIRRIGAIKNGEEVTGNMTRVKVVKNKVAPPFREAEFEIMYGQGISREGEIIELGSSLGIIEKSGAWYAYKGSRIGQGKDNARAYLLANKEVAREVEAQRGPARQGRSCSGRTRRVPAARAGPPPRQSGRQHRCTPALQQRIAWSCSYTCLNEGRWLPGERPTNHYTASHGPAQIIQSGQYTTAHRSRGGAHGGRRAARAAGLRQRRAAREAVFQGV